MTKITEEKKSFKLFNDYEKMCSALSNEEAGLLFKAILAHENGKEGPELAGALNGIFILIVNQLDRDRKAYEDKCDTNKKNGFLGGRPKNQPDIEDTQNNQSDIEETQNNQADTGETQSNRTDTGETQITQNNRTVLGETEDNQTVLEKTQANPEKPDTDTDTDTGTVTDTLRETDTTAETDEVARARGRKDITSFTREEMESAAVDDLTAEYAEFFNDPGGARDIVTGLVSEFGLSLAFDCIHEVGARASPKRPQVPSAYIREMCRNRGGG